MAHSFPLRQWVYLSCLGASAGALFLPGLAWAADCVNGAFINLSTTCEVPSGVAQIKIDAWGGGAGGGNFANIAGGSGSLVNGAGGGGGSYCGASFNVAGGTTLTITVGAGGAAQAGGNPSSVTGAGISGLTANGGSYAATGGAGGTTAGCTATGPTTFPGGAGGARRLTEDSAGNTGGSGGGGSAGAGSVGGNGATRAANNNANVANGGTAGTGTPAGAAGGQGGYTGGGLNLNGVAGTAPGGGGGGARNSNNATGGVGAAGRVVISWSECGTGLPFTTAQWTMLALPCVPSAGTPSVANVFGSGTGSNLNTANYNTAGVGWVIDKRNVGVAPAYQRLLITENVSIDTGYWIKSYQAPTGNTLTVAGTHATTNATLVQGCAVAAGCRAITVTTPAATTNRFNLVGNPFAYAIDWSKVRIRVNGSASTYTPSQAAGVAVSGNASPPVLSNEVNIWNGTTYDTISDAVVPPYHNLRYFQSFWVNVLPGAFGQTIELLIPAEVSTFLSQAEPAAQPLPWYLGWLDWMVPPAAAAKPAPQRPAVSEHVQPQALPDSRDWYVRIKVDNHATGWKDHGLLLGQLTDALPGYDPNDQAKMAPFAQPYLMLVFPQPGWGDKKGDYATDFRAVTGQPDTWTFEIRAEPVGSQVFLSWEGERAILKRSQLVNVATGEVIQPADGRWARKGYPLTLDGRVTTLTWRYLGT